MQSRRMFIGKVATGLAGTLAASNVLGANDRIRIGIIGAGDRGTEILRQALACRTPNAWARPTSTPTASKRSSRSRPTPRPISITATCWTIKASTPSSSPRRSTCIPSASSPRSTPASTSTRKRPWRSLWITPSACAPLTSAPSGRTVQIGHQWTSLGQFTDAVSFLKPELMGKITAIQAHMYRNTPHGKPQWSRPDPSRHDAGEHHLEVVPGRGARSTISTPTATSTGASSGIIPAATSTRTCATSSPSGTRR